MEAAESIGAGSEGRVKEWALAHQALSKLRLKRGALDAEEGTWLLRAFRAATHVYFGYASFGEYIERLFGLNRRAIEEKLRVAGALEALPELAEALRSAKLNWSVVRELSRVAVPETEREWILAVCGKTAREVERMVSGLAPGDRPTDRRRRELVRHILRFEVGAETLATFREAMKELQKRSDHRLDDDAALLSMAREVLGGPGDAGRASYQVVVTQCEDCGRGFQHASGELIELDPAIVEMCHCDAQNVPVAHPHSAVGGALEGPVANARHAAESQAHPGNSDEIAPARCLPAHLHLGNSDKVAQAGCLPAHPHVGNSDDIAGARGAQAYPHLRGPDDFMQARTHVGDTEAPPSGASLARVNRQRATQGTPPAIRRQVFWRDRGRCIVPGCRNTTYLDIHHLDLRSEGGGNEPDNLVVLCGAHHGALHRGRLRIDGKVSTGLRVSHADGTAYGFLPSSLLADASASAFAALRKLGFTEKTARASERSSQRHGRDASALRRGSRELIWRDVESAWRCRTASEVLAGYRENQKSQSLGPAVAANNTSSDCGKLTDSLSAPWTTVNSPASAASELHSAVAYPQSSVQSRAPVASIVKELSISSRSPEIRSRQREPTRRSHELDRHTGATTCACNTPLTSELRQTVPSFAWLRRSGSSLSAQPQHASATPIASRLLPPVAK